MIAVRGSAGSNDIRQLCAAALTIVLQKTTLSDRPNFQPPSFRMKWQILSVPWSQRRRRFKDVVITSEAPFPTRRRRCTRWDASEGSAFANLLLGFASASKLGQQLRAIVHTTNARIEATKFPVMNCTKKGGGPPSFFSFWQRRKRVDSASSSCSRACAEGAAI
jgi:hypothetical protein